MFQLCCTQRRIPGEYPAAADVRGGAGVLGPGPGDSSTRPRSGTWRGCCWAWPSTGPSSPSGIQPTRISSGPNHHWCDPLRVPDISSGDTYLVSRKVDRKSCKVENKSFGQFFQKVIWLKIPRLEQDGLCPRTLSHQLSDFHMSCPCHTGGNMCWSSGSDTALTVMTSVTL